MGASAEHTLQFLSHLNAATHDDDVDVVGGPFKEDVTDIAADDIALNAEAVGSLADLVEYRLVENLCQLLV